MKKLFIIGTGRNGSKITGKVIGTAVDISDIFGEVHHGLKPVFFRDTYLGKVSTEEAVRKIKISRDKAMLNVNNIYVEKNHLVVPVLDQVLEAYPDASFLYVYRYPKDIVRSFYVRNVYTGHTNMYEDGRLIPNEEDKYYNLWPDMGKFEKICWYVSTMMGMCDNFLGKQGGDMYRIITYDSFVQDPTVFSGIFSWLGLDFNLNKINGVLGKQIGSSARSESELAFVVNQSKLKNSKHWSNWSEKQNIIYRKYFNE